MEEKEDFSLLVHNFLKSIRAKEIPESKIKEFFEFVDNLKEGTDIQKRRFFMFFDVKENQKLETYTSISKKENCTCSAIRNSVNRIRSLLVWVKDEERNNLIKIIKSNDM